MKNLLLCLGLLIPALLPAQQVPKGLTAANGQYVGFYEYKPPAYSTNSTQTFPLIIFLHGIGERGDGTSSLPAVLNVGIPRNIHYGLTDMTFNYNGTQQSFLVLSPQLSFNYGNWQTFYIDEMIKYAKNNLRVDVNRIYLTGLSLGGGGVWKYASSSLSAAQGLAAIAPICGTCDWSNLCNISNGNLPVWAFHAMDDGVVGVGCTQSAVSAIGACSPSVAPLTTYYPTGNHWIWDQVYDPSNPQLYMWFLSKSRGSSGGGGGGGGGAINTPPVANAGTNQTITLPTSSTTLSGTGSYDSDGSISSYAWSQVSGPNTATLSGANAANATISNLVAGTYTFKLTVTDNSGATNSANVSITVNQAAAPTNQPPVAVAGSNQTITLPTNSVFLYGSGSYDPGGGSITKYDWTQQSGPNNATITAISTTNVEVKGMVAGTYVFKLTVTDNQGATGASTVQVTVNGGAAAAPVANAGANQTLTLPTNSTTLNGSGSSNAVTYNWTEVAGPSQAAISNSTGINANVSNMVAGTYTFRLTVGNAAGATSTADVQVVVSGSTPPPSGNGPVAVATASSTTVALPSNTVFLMGSGSYVPGGGSISNYAWSQQSGPSNATLTTISATNVQASNLTAGTYVFKLTVTDSKGATGTGTVTVTVTGTNPTDGGGGSGGGSGGGTGNTPPVAVPGNNQTITLPTNSVFLYGSGSYDPGGWITNYAWTQQSGPSNATISTISSTNVQVTNMVAGTYVFKLTVTDNGGATGTATVSVTVNGSAPPPPAAGAPVAVAGSDQYVTLPNHTVYLMGGSSYDVGGWITKFTWTQESGPSTATLTAISASNAEAKNLVAGTYTFRLTVTDNSGLTGTSTMKVNVYSAGGRTASTTTTSTSNITTTNNTTTAAAVTTAAAPLPAQLIETTSTKSNSLVLYPNPVTTAMTVQVSNSKTGSLQINILNAAGAAVKSIKASKASTQFTQQVNMQDIAPGTYVVEMIFSDGTRLKDQVVKQ